MRETNELLPIVNAELLHKELAAALGLPLADVGVSTYGPDRPISVFVPDSATEADLKIVSQVCAAHDPTKAPPKVVPETVTDVQTQIDQLKAQIAALQAAK